MQTNNNGNQGRDSRDNQNDNRNTENPSNQNEQNMGNRGNHMDDDWGNSTQRGHESDGPRMRGRDINEDPDFGGSISSNAPEGNINAQASESGGFNGDDNMSDRERRDASEAQSRTFNEDEETWEEEKRMGSSNANRGSEGNDWNQNDQMQRSPGRGGSEENRDASSSDYYERDRDNLNTRNNTSSRSNNGDDF